MTNLEYYTVATSDASNALWQKCFWGVCLAANTILGEPATTPNHDARVAWAKRVCADPMAFVLANRSVILSNGTIATGGANSTDADINWVCATLLPPTATGNAGSA
jgi:hypothetical protein